MESASFTTASVIMARPRRYLIRSYKSSLQQRSLAYRAAGRKSEADVTLEEAAQIAQDNLNKEPEMASIVEEYSQFLRRRGNKKEADKLHAEAVRARTSTVAVTRANLELD